MGYHDREYARRDPPPTGLTGGVRLWSFTTWLIVINVAVFIIDALLASQVRVMVNAMPFPPLAGWGHFSADTALEKFQVWRFLTFQFLHGGVGHLFFNMLALYFFGPMIENYLGSRRYLAFYLLCGIAGAVLYVVLWMSKVLDYPSVTPLVGASAGIYGVLIAAARIAPHTTVMLLFPPIPMKLRTLAWVMMGFVTYNIFTGGSNAGGDAGHLGGAVLGFLLIRKPGFLNFADRRMRAAKSTGVGEKRSWQPRPTPSPEEEAEIDRILAKVSRDGLNSLSSGEREKLRAASEKYGQ